MKKIIILLFAALSSLSMSAQVAHEFSMNGGGGLSTLNYKLSSGKKSFGYGGDFELGYTCIFKELWGIHIGMGLGFYNSKTNLDDVQIVTSNLRDSENDCFNLYSTLNSYTETQNAMFLNIPVMIQFQTRGKQKFYAKVGVKVGLPINCKYSVLGGTITNEGYYPDYDNWLTMPEFAGFGTFTNQYFNGELKLAVTAMLAAEIGAKWKLGEKVALYTGFYFDYGLNNSLKDKPPFVDYINSYPAKFTVNSALPSLTDKIKPMAIGIKLRFALVNKKAVEKEEDNEKEEDI